MELLQRALASAQDTFVGLKWVNDEMITPEIRKHMLYALLFLIAGNTSLMLVPYTFGELLAAEQANDQLLSNQWIMFGVTTSITAALLSIGYDHFRERAWNAKYLTSNITVMGKLLERTIEELIDDKSEIGVEHAESIKDRVKNIIYLVLFDFSVVLVTIASANTLTFTVDGLTGWLLLLVTLFNLGWFFIWNAAIDEKMEVVDEEFRRASRRMVDKLTVAPLSIKSAGVEKKVEEQTRNEIQVPLKKDLHIWAIWFLKIETMRRVVNAIAPFAIILVGLRYGSLDPTKATAAFVWVFLVTREYGFIGHLMRHLAGEVARLKAARVALTQPPSFRTTSGAPYTPQPLNDIERNVA